MDMLSQRSRVWAVLGPTNTGKTYLAIERMLGHATGMIGFPLRLLARENYDRIVAKHGRRSVALITGEEKIIPPRPRWYVCTVESMPLDKPVEFLAVDEIQLCADRERGHIFTDRLMHARGRSETMFLGSDIVAPVLRVLVPDADIESRPRFSTLTYTGSKKLGRLPRRTAIVAFSVNAVYELAEMVRRQRGGTAVVLGALSPRTRNAQVEMYQNGEVDYMVATDAIGMGLNMEVDHVAFAGLRKFDGRSPRPLTPQEIGQIAGRAGRHLSDGSFGVTMDVRPISDDVVEAVETHRYESLDHAFWRNRSLDFRSVSHLLASLEERPAHRMLYMARRAEDHLVLKTLAQDDTVMDRAANPAAVRLLWDVCQIPDFRKVMADVHARLIRRIFLSVMEGDGRLPNEWVSAQMSRLDNCTGDIDTLTQRIAHVRTWTYISHHAEWLDNAGQWQMLARSIEDRLSDALHDRLTQRFVDRRAPLFAKRAKSDEAAFCYVGKNGDVVVDGHSIGHLRGLRFEADEALSQAERRALLSVARKAILQEVARRLDQLCAETKPRFKLGSKNRIMWEQGSVAIVRAGPDVLSPQVVVSRNEFLDGAQRNRLHASIAAWLGREMRHQLRPLFVAREADANAAVRGIVYQLSEGLGTVPRLQAERQLRHLSAQDKKVLAKLGVRLGLHILYFRQLLDAPKRRFRGWLASVYLSEKPPKLPRKGKVSVATDAISDDMWSMTGYCVFGGRAFRADAAEKFAAYIRKQAKEGPIALSPALLTAAGCDAEGIVAVMRGLGLKAKPSENGVMFHANKKRRAPSRSIRPAPGHEHSPFAVLRDMAAGK